MAKQRTEELEKRVERERRLLKKTELKSLGFDEIENVDVLGMREADESMAVAAAPDMAAWRSLTLSIQILRSCRVAGLYEHASAQLS